MDMLAIPTDKAGNDRARPRSMEGTVTFNACGLLPVLLVLVLVVVLVLVLVVLVGYASSEDRKSK
jgi:hypothetical protein